MGLHRRGVLKAGGLTGASLLGGAGRRRVALVLDANDPVANSQPVERAKAALRQALISAGFDVSPRSDGASFTVTISGPAANERRQAESFTITQLSPGHNALHAAGGDARGLSYALYELADRVRRDPATALSLAAPIGGQPVNPVRSVVRQFTCEAYDKPWFYDRDMWPAYMAMLAASRFNRLHLAFGLAYDQLSHVKDSYFLFTYPFLLDVPGYGVRVSGLSDAERDRNLDTLRFISDQAAAHGLDFELGLWMHGYQWPAMPGVPVIDGLTPQTHADYCRDAMTLLLKKLPAVSSVALRIHGESGIKEGSYGFWKTVFSGVAAAGRPVEIDLHAKGVDQAMIDNALATGMPVAVSPKYWGEHFGMPYHQAAIRAYEMPAAGQTGKGLMTLSEGARSFTRYGYADLLRDDRRYIVRHRIFPGTQRLLASAADPAYGAMFGFCGSTGADVMEPLTYRGRRGSATATNRSGYAARRLQSHWDWQKYDGWYRSFGRVLYDPKTAPAPQDDLSRALILASRLLPIVTTAYAPSAACDAYWPEVYWNQPLAAEPTPNPYGDNLAPKLFDNATPFDPQLFSSMREHAAELMAAGGAKVSPVQVATWLEDIADQTDGQLNAAGKPRDVAAMRLQTDIAVQARLGRFFAAKFRSGVLFALYNLTQDRRAIDAAVARYRSARGHWAAIITLTDGVYGDVSSSDVFTEHGAWADKLALIDADIAAVQALSAEAKASDNPELAKAVAMTLKPARVRPAPLVHTPPDGFTSGHDIALTFTGEVERVRLWYRHVNQAETWQSVDMTRNEADWTAVIPADYAASPYPLQYYAEARDTAGACLYPGFAEGWGAQPYVVLRCRG